ncbi:MAG: hypothetical protein K0S32_1793 [Bacteroidetes bacterium]|nr:hypothetical protein [Bacteroidota bacterium]
MKRSIFGPIIFGILFGAAAFFAPFFLLKAVFFLMIVGFIFRMFWWRRRAWHYGYHYQLAYAEKVRNMSEEEFSQFKNKFRDCNGYYNRGCYGDHYCNRDSYRNCETKQENKQESTENK